MLFRPILRILVSGVLLVKIIYHLPDLGGRQVLFDEINQNFRLIQWSFNLELCLLAMIRFLFRLNRLVTLLMVVSLVLVFFLTVGDVNLLFQALDEITLE